MSATLTVDPVCPLTPAAGPAASLVEDGHLSSTKFKALLKQALQLYDSRSKHFIPGRSFALEHDATVKVSKASPGIPQSPRHSRCNWHARTSTHDAKNDVHHLTFDDFREGLFVDHPIKERQYIHEIIRYDRIGEPVGRLTLDPALSRYVTDVRADFWITEYKLPIMTSDRDFFQLFLTIELAPHADPLSEKHIAEVLAALEGQGGEASTSNEAAVSTGRRSCINIQLPVTSPDCPPKSHGFVRATYVSVEAIRELQDDKTEWWMAVQSDSAGRVPLMFQEMAMPSKVAPDVPCFIGWAMKQKKEAGGAQ